MRVTPRMRFAACMVLMTLICFAVAWGVTRVVRGVEALMFSEPAHSPSEYSIRR